LNFSAEKLVVSQVVHLFLFGCDEGVELDNEL